MKSETANLISIIADIREKSGVGAKPMLGELADAIAAEMNRRERRGIERAARFHDDQADQFEKAAFQELSVSRKMRNDDAAGQHRKVAAAIRQLGGTP